MNELLKKIENLQFKSNKSCDDYLKLLGDLVELYTLHRPSLTDDQISKVRAYMSSAVYMLISNCYETYMDNLIQSELKSSKKESEIFKKYVNKFISEGYSKSQSIELSRKTLKSDDEYQTAIMHELKSKASVKLIDKIIRAAEQVLNSMSKR